MKDIVILIICLVGLFVGGYLIIKGCTLDNDKYSFFIGVAIILTVVVYVFVFPSDNSQYIPAEPFAHNQTQTVFTTNEGTYIADGLYPDGTYLLTVDGKDVLVVWQAVDGEVG